MKLVQTKIASSISLMPGDELTVTVDVPMMVQIVQTENGEPADVRMRKEWFDARDLRKRVQQLTLQVKRLRWQLEHPPDELDGRVDA